MFKQEGETMTPKNLRRLAAYGGITALVLAVMLILGSGSATSAQSEDAGSHKRLEGVWRFQVTVRNCQTGEPLRTFPALFTFAKGGTLNRDDRRPVPRPKYSRPGCLAAHGRRHLQRGVRGLRF